MAFVTDSCTTYSMSEKSASGRVSGSPLRMASTRTAVVDASFCASDISTSFGRFCVSSSILRFQIVSRISRFAVTRMSRTSSTGFSSSGAGDPSSGSMLSR